MKINYTQQHAHTSLCLSFLLCFAHAKAQSDFTDTTTWTPVTIGAGPILQTIPNGFTVSIPGSTGSSWAAGYKLAYALHGDFTIDTGFILNTWPAGNGVRMGITLLNAEATVERSSKPFNAVGDAYVFPEPLSSFIPTDDQTGTLRLTRTGLTLAGLYLEKSGQWVTIGSIPMFGAGDVLIDLQAWSDPSHFANQNVEGTFLDTSISSIGSLPPGQFVPVTENSSMLVGAMVALPLGLHFLYGFRNRKTASVPTPWPDV